MKANELKPAEYNPRKITDDTLTVLKKSMAEFGDLSGIVYNVRTGNLVGGHQRVKNIDPKTVIERTETLDNIGTIAVGWIETEYGKFSYREVDWDVIKEKAANVTANNTLLQGEFDTDTLEELLKELSVDYAGFDDFKMGELAVDLDLLIEDIKIDEDKSKPASTIKDSECPKCGFKW